MSDIPVTSERYQYHPLTEQGTIRLLKLESSDDTATAVRASLDVAELENAPEFEALSYCWGVRSKDEPKIHIDGQSLSVTKDLHSALLRLRQREKPIWIDAICINQEDTTERTQQVRQMHRIYGSASLVIVWLGEASPENIQGFAFAEMLMSEFKDYVREQRGGQGWTGSRPAGIDANDIVEYAQVFGGPFLAHAVQQTAQHPPAAAMRPGIALFPVGVFTYIAIFAKDWFVRSWIVQEICLARHVLVKCGAIEKSFDEFYDAKRVYECAGLGLYVGTIPKAASAILGGQALDSISRLRDRLLYGREPSAARNLISRVMEFGYSFATDPRDKVFALVGLTSPEDVPGILQPDYSIESTFSKVCLHMARHYLSEGAPLVLAAVLSCPDCPFGHLELPSWTADLRQLSCRIAQVSLTFQEMGAFSASARTLLTSRTSQDGKALVVRGRRFDVISDLGDYRAKTTALHQFELQTRPPLRYADTPDVATWESEQDDVRLKVSEMRSVVNKYYNSLFTTALEKITAQAMYVTGEPLTEAFWRTMCCNRDIERGANDIYAASRQGMGPIMTRDGYEPSSITGAAILGYFGIEGPILPDDQTAPALMNVPFLTNGRNWGITEGGYMGWVPFATKLGDEIAIIEGQDAPFVIRPVGEFYHRLIGECYIHGVMKGEIVLAEDYKAEAIFLV